MIVRERPNGFGHARLSWVGADEQQRADISGADSPFLCSLRISAR